MKEILNISERVASNHINSDFKTNPYLQAKKSSFG